MHRPKRKRLWRHVRRCRRLLVNLQLRRFVLRKMAGILVIRKKWPRPIRLTRIGEIELNSRMGGLKLLPSLPASGKGNWTIDLSKSFGPLTAIELPCVLLTNGTMTPEIGFAR